MGVSVVLLLSFDSFTILTGVPQSQGGTVRLAKTIGRPAALDMALRGKLLDAPEAEKIGLIHTACETAKELEEATMALALELGSKAPLAMTGVLQAIMEGAELPILEGIEIEYAAQRRSAGSADAKEGIAAFLAKPRREPVWKGY